jgi:hypothetical protein
MCPPQVVKALNTNDVQFLDIKGSPLQKNKKIHGSPKITMRSLYYCSVAKCVEQEFPLCEPGICQSPELSFMPPLAHRRFIMQSRLRLVGSFTVMAKRNNLNLALLDERSLYVIICKVRTGRNLMVFPRYMPQY